MTSSEDSLPNADSKRGRCTRCGYLAQFTVEETQTIATLSTTPRNIYEKVDTLTCMGCNQSMIVISTEVWSPEGFGVESSEPIFYFPPPGVGVLDESVPTKIASCFDEGQRCLSIGAHRAAVVMFRGALAEFVEANASTNAKSKRDLFARLEQMASENDLHSSLVGWAQIIRTTGNEGAHTEKYENVTKEMAHAMATLTRQLIYLHYEVPAQVDRAKTKSSLPKAPSF